MKKKVILSCIKEFLPVILISLVVLTSFAIAAGNIRSFAVYTNNPDNPDLYLNIHNTEHYLFFIPAFIIMIFTPYFAMNYRYSLPKADFYMALPLKEKQLKRYRLLVLLIGLLLTFTVAYLVYYLTSYITYVSQLEKLASVEYRVVIPYNFIYFIPAYFISLVFLVAHYFAAAALFNQSNNGKQAYNIVVIAFLSVLFLYPTIHSIADLVGNSPFGEFAFGTSPAFGAPLYFLQQFLYRLPYEGGVFTLGNTTFQTVIISINLGITVLAGVGCASYLLLVKDPSGEYSGKVEFRNYLPISFVHALAVLLFLLIATFVKITTPIIYIVEFILAIVGYYVIFALFTRSFRISKVNLIIMGIVVAGFAISSAIFAVI